MYLHTLEGRWEKIARDKHTVYIGRVRPPQSRIFAHVHNLTSPSQEPVRTLDWSVLALLVVQVVCVPSHEEATHAQ